MAKEAKEVKGKSIRNPAIEAIISNIERKMGSKGAKGVIFRYGDRPAVSVETLSFGYPEVDEASNCGGIARGKVIEIFGQESGGKSFLSLKLIASAQKKGLICCLVDAEQSFQADWAKKHGVNVDDLIILNDALSAETILDYVATMSATEGIGLIVVDSTAALTPEKELEGSVSDQDYALLARAMSKALRKIISGCGKTKATCVFLNQIREKMGVVFGNPETTPGGRALRFYAHQRIMVTPGKNIKVQDGEKEKVVARKSYVRFVKNKCIASGEVIFNPSEGRCYFVDELIDKKDFSVLSMDDKKNIITTYAKSCNKQSVEPCFEIGVRGVGNLTTNGQHPFLTPEGWVNAEDLKKRDLVAIISKIEIPINPIINSKWDKNSAILSGMLIGDGCTGGKTGISLRNFSSDCVDKLSESIKKFGCETYEKVDQKGLWVIRQYDGGHKGKENDLNTFLKNNEMFGKKAIDKIVPPDIFFCSSEIKGAFIGGLIATDGWVSKDGKDWSIGITTISKKLAEGIRHLLLSEGIIPSISKRNPKKGGGVDGRQIIGKNISYIIRVRKEKYIRKLLNIIGWSGGKLDKISYNTENESNETDGICWKRVKYNKVVDAKMTYDICDSGFSNFETHGIITHNTAAPMGECEIEIVFFEEAMNPVVKFCNICKDAKLIGQRDGKFQIKKDVLGEKKNLDTETSTIIELADYVVKNDYVGKLIKAYESLVEEGAEKNNKYVTELKDNPSLIVSPLNGKVIKLEDIKTDEKLNKELAADVEETEEAASGGKVEE